MRMLILILSKDVYSMDLNIESISKNGYTKYVSFTKDVRSVLIFDFRHFYPQATISFGNENKLSLSYAQTLGGNSNKFRDYDYLSDQIDMRVTGSSNFGLDIYGETKTETNFQEAAVKFSKKLSASKSIQFGLVKEIYTFRGFDLKNYGYGGYNKYYTLNRSGDVIAYKVEYYSIPIAYEKKLKFTDFSIDQKIEVGPVYAKDRDDHILRSKLNHIYAAGYTFDGSFSVQKDIDQNSIFCELGINHKRAFGYQHQKWYRKTNECPTGKCEGYVRAILDSFSWNVGCGIRIFF